MKSDAVVLGQKLKIPGAITPAAEPEPAKVAETPTPAPQAARSHTIVRGDTLERIARSADEARFQRRDAFTPLWEQRVLPGRLFNIMVRRPLKITD